MYINKGENCNKNEAKTSQNSKICSKKGPKVSNLHQINNKKESILYTTPYHNISFPTILPIFPCSTNQNAYHDGTNKQAETTSHPPPTQPHTAVPLAAP